MSMIRFAGFRGENRALQAMLLPDTVGVSLRHLSPSTSRRLLGYSSLSIPPSLYSVLNRIELNAIFFNPIYQRLCFTKGSYKPVCSRISMLLRGACPPAIFWGVVPVVVDSVKRIAIWFIAHIGNKVSKPINPIPTLTDANPPAAVVCELTESRVVATMSHLRPCRVKGVMFSPFNKSISCYGPDVVLSSKASARGGMAASQCMRVHKRLPPAFAEAFPLYGPIALNSRFAAHGESAKYLSGEVYKRAHFYELLNKVASIVLCKNQEVAINSFRKVGI